MSSRRFYLACATIAATAIGMIAWAEYAEAQGQVPCGPSAEMIAKLKADYNETQVGVGVINQQAVMTLFASPDGETWTILGIGTDGGACVLGAGEHLVLDQIKDGEPA